MRAVRTQAHIVHRVKDPALNRLKTVPSVGQRPAYDHAHGVIQVSLLHFLVDIDRSDAGLFDAMVVCAHVFRPVGGITIA